MPYATAGQPPHLLHRSSAVLLISLLLGPSTCGLLWSKKQSPAKPAASDPMQVQEGYVTSDDGFRLYYQKIGAGPVLIAPGRLFLFNDFKQLADQYTLISYDMRDRGRSDSISDGTKLTIQNDVRDLEAVRQHFQVARFTPIGYSYLGLMVVMYAMEHPGQVERVVQMGPVPMNFDTTYPPNLVADDSNAVPDPTELAKLGRLKKEGYSTSHPKDYCEKEWAVTRYGLVGNPANVEKVGNGWCDMPNEWPVNLDRHFRYSIGSVKKLVISKAQVATVKVPVLTIHGTKDRNAPYGSGREWASSLPNARLLTIEGGAHQSFAEYPEIVFPAIRIFLAGKWPEAAEKIPAM